MLQQENYRELQLKNIFFNDIINLNLEKIQLKSTPLLNQYLYQSKGFKILSWDLNPEIIFLIIYGNNNITVETDEKLIKGVGSFSGFIKIRIKLKIVRNSKDYCDVKRSIILGMKKKPKFLKFIPNNILNKLLSQALELIAKRLDKKLLLKLSNLCLYK